MSFLPIKCLKVLVVFSVGFVVGSFLSFKFVYEFGYLSRQGTFKILSKYTKDKKISADELYDETLSENLFHEVKIICWIVTHPENHRNKSLHIKSLWGKRCNKLLFMSTEEDPELGTVALPVGAGRGQLWHKTLEIYKYVSHCKPT
jgi:glycoprotein-N-acetylgalactosamine 3-beta-galactosyltransferase